MKVVLPREHGAWGMLFGPLLAGMIAGGFRVYDVFLVLGMLAAYLASNPLLQWVKQPQRKAHMKKWAFGYGIAALLFGMPLAFVAPKLLWLALPACLSLLVNIRFALRKQERHLLNDLAGSAGLCLGVVASYYLGQRTFAVESWYLWGAFVLQFFGSALYVKTLIREKGNRNVKMAANFFQALMLFLSLVIGMVLPDGARLGWLIVAFAFSTVKVWLTPYNISLKPLTVGIIEIANTVWFTVVVGLIFRA